MDEIDRIPDHVLHRLPGLFRRWELAQVIETGKDYRFEDAGPACDGTTLYAVYIGAAVVPEGQIEKDLELPSRPDTGWRRGKSCAVAEAAGPVSEDRMPVGQMKAVR
jgi:hypothetical protein